MQDHSLSPPRFWFEKSNKSSLFDISSWDSAGTWSSWDLGEVPYHLMDLVDPFLIKLQGAAPIQKQAMCSRGWGENGYTFKGGYVALLHQPNMPKKSNV